MVKRYGIIPALDCEHLDDAVRLVEALGSHSFVQGFKLGFSLGLTYGLPDVVRTLKDSTDLPLIYDHQKAGTDIPDTGALFARTLRKAGIDAAILFPQAGPQTLRGWIRALQDEGVEAIGGGAMTHPAYLVSEGGYIADEAVLDMYAIAREERVAVFVLPLTKPVISRTIVAHANLGEDCTIVSPGFGAQGGDPATFDFVKRHYLIIGRALLRANDPVEYVNGIERQLRNANEE
jgi:orotidine-5'-phosphate decarboxylase